MTDYIDQLGKNVEVVLDPRGSIPVAVQDQFTRSITIPFCKTTSEGTTVATIAVAGQRVIAVANATGIIVGMQVLILGTNYYLFAAVTGVAGNNLTIDQPIDKALAVGFQVIPIITDMGVNGAVTPQVFSLRGSAGTFDLPFEMDITRIQGLVITATAPIISDFGDIAGGIPNGIVMRETIKGITNNLGVVKNNGELALVSQVNSFASKVSATDFGFTFDIVFNGPENRGVTKRLGPDDSIDVIVQDDLLSILSINMVGIGHIVE